MRLTQVPQPVDEYVDQQAAIASLFAQSGSCGTQMRPMSDYDRMTDEQIAVAKLFG